MTTCVILRIDDFTLYKVTTSGKKQALKEFICGDRGHMQLPKDASIIHAEFIYYYYPNDIPFPLPPPKFYVQLNPILVVFDLDSVLWLNSFGLNLYQSLMNSKNEVQVSDYTYIDVKIEAILPRVNFESVIDHPTQRDRPKCLSFQVTRATITNVRSLEQSSRADLAKCVDSFHMGSLFFGTDFPSQSSDFYIVTQKFIDHISASDNIRNVPNQLDISSLNALIEQFSREMLWIEAKDVWCINLDPVWGDFHGARAVGLNRPVPFLDAVPITLWLHTHMDPNSTLKPNELGRSDVINADIHALAHISNLVSVQINHYQYLFLLRLAEDAAELATFLSMDSDRILKVESNSSFAVGAIIPCLEVTFVMPSQCPGKESSGGDVESFVPDSSSIADDMIVGSAATVWQTSSLSITQPDNPKKTIANGSGNPFELSSSYSMDFPQYNQESKSISRSMAQPQSPQLGNINIQNNLNADSALKPSPDDVSDTMSIRSDASSDSEKFVILNCETDIPGPDLMFFVMDFAYDHGRVEEASEVIEEESTVTSASDHSVASSCKRKDLVSVSTFKLNKVEFLQQSVGYSSTIKVQLGTVSNEDCSSIPWDEFQSKFSTRSRAWADNSMIITATSKVKIRLDHMLTLPSSKSMMDLDFTNRDNLRKLFKDLHTGSGINTKYEHCDGLADLAEDEIIPKPIPMEINIENLHLHLNEDRPPVNITSPGPVPIDLDITQLFITRTEDGIFHFKPDKPPSTSSTSSIVIAQELEQNSTKLNRQLSADNEELKRRLQSFERISEENRLLRKAKEETDILRTCLKTSQDDVVRLLDEKQKLLDEIKKLQEQFGADRGWQWNSSKR
ncbi:hypothetical protein NQ317_007376 [Molorchus minor]|uniref:UHRF1-binding protein 1-like n=1 Tax=Molorchus minor TaxID=1323400 RepID=A0ABQ9IZD5_9CUCU|nr:hypothetical protein NQ317_007376 [Molorchus minor]